MMAGRQGEASALRSDPGAGFRYVLWLLREMGRVTGRWRGVAQVPRSVRLVCTVAIANVVSGVPLAQAQQPFPAKPVRIVVPFPPGPADLVARLYAQKLGERWKQSVVIENRPGATGTIGADAVAKAAPDGYTILYTVDLPVVMAPALMRTPYDPVKDLLPVAGVVDGMNLLAVHPSAGVSTLAELVAAAKARPGALSFASAGNASPGHVCGEMLKAAAGVDMTHVPYRGAGPASQAVLIGEVTAFCGPIAALLPSIRAGKLRAIGVTGEQPSTRAPEIPPLSSSYPSVVVSNWSGFFVPPRTPVPVVEELRQEIRATFDDPELAKRLHASGFDPRWIPAADLTRLIEADLVKWARIIRATNIRAD